MSFSLIYFSLPVLKCAVLSSILFFCCLLFARGMMNSTAAPTAEWFVDHHSPKLTVTRLRIAREQHLQVVLSQRLLGVPVTLQDCPFVQRSQHLSDADTALLSSVTNAGLFNSLCAAATGPATSRADDWLSSANPHFFFRYSMPIAVDAGSEGSTVFSPQIPLAGFARRRRRQRGEGGAEPAAKRSRAEPSSSTSGGLVAQSLQKWEAHLTQQLQEEGTSLEGFRQRSKKESFLEKKRFQQDADWNEYQRELQLTQKNQELQAKRSIRRGERE